MNEYKRASKEVGFVYGHIRKKSAKRKLRKQIRQKLKRNMG